MNYAQVTAEFERLSAEIREAEAAIERLPKRVVSGWKCDLIPYGDQTRIAMLFVPDGRNKTRIRRVASVVHYQGGYYSAGFDQSWEDPSYFDKLQHHIEGSDKEEVERFIRTGLCERNILVSPDVDLSLPV